MNSGEDSYAETPLQLASAAGRYTAFLPLKFSYHYDILALSPRLVTEIAQWKPLRLFLLGYREGGSFPPSPRDFAEHRIQRGSSRAVSLPFLKT